MSITIYGKRVVDALTEPRTLMDLVGLTTFGISYVLRGIMEARTVGHRIFAVSHRGEPTTYELRGELRD